MLEFIKKRKALIIAFLVIAVITIVTIKIRLNGPVETVSPVTGDLVRMVKISGKVVPDESVELGFEIPGTVSNISKQVGDEVRRGDLLVKIDTSGISSDIQKAEAELALARAELDKLDGTGVYETQIENAKRTLIQTMIDAYNVADDAVFNKADQIFLNPRTDYPEIPPTPSNYVDLRNSIIRNRIVIGRTIDTWKSLITGLNTATYSEERLSLTKKYLSEASAFISDVARAVNTFEVSNTLTQTTIDTYRDALTSARNNLNNPTQSLITAEDKLRGLLLEVPVQVARVEGARATLLNYRSQLSKSYLISPINGIVARQDTKIGQVVSSLSSIASVISKKFEIEAYIPEVLISGVSVGNPASITLDAYGNQEIFTAKITHIDPAETIRDGVSTYKVKLEFTNQDNRIRSGMTANINIETFRKDGVLLLPERAVISKNGESFVYMLRKNNQQVKTPVTIGEKDSQGNVELISELPGDSELIKNPIDN